MRNAVTVPVHVAREIAQNVAMKITSVRRWRLNRPRAGVSFTGDDAQLTRYAFQALDTLRDVLNEDLTGKQIGEIGPGDFLTSGLSLLAAGAAHYTAMDRFVGDYARLEGKQWYEGIEREWAGFYPGLPGRRVCGQTNFPSRTPTW